MSQTVVGPWSPQNMLGTRCLVREQAMYLDTIQNGLFHYRRTPGVQERTLIPSHSVPLRPEKLFSTCWRCCCDSFDGRDHGDTERVTPLSDATEATTGAYPVPSKNSNINFDRIPLTLYQLTADPSAGLSQASTFAPGQLFRLFLVYCYF